MASWVVWWGLLTGFWIGVDYSLQLPELLVGAAVAAVAALLLELVEYQADTYVRVRPSWLLSAPRLPGQVVRDTGIVLSCCGGRWHAVSSRGTRSREPDRMR